MKLYRGDAAVNLQRGVYGMSWSGDKNIAREFAQGFWQMLEGGSILLEVDAPANAIISTDRSSAGNLGESEYIVDRRRLKSVRVIEQFAYRTGYPG
jgi:hypothetical protein